MFKKFERGQTIVLFVLAVIGIIGMVALAVDGGNVLLDRRRAQNAADTAAYAAGLARLRGLDFYTPAYALAADNGYDNGLTNDIFVSLLPAYGCGGLEITYPSASDYIHVMIQTTVDAFFAQVVGWEQFHNCVEAVAHAIPSETVPHTLNNGIIALGNSGCGITLQGNTVTAVIDGGLFSNADFCNQSVSADLTAGSLEVVGTITASSPGIVIPVQNEGAVPIDLDTIMWPAVSCSGTYGVEDFPDGDNKTVQLTPGNISGNFPPALSGGRKVVFLTPGIYCISGDVSLNSDIAGTNILLYMSNGQFYTNGGAVISLTGRTDPSDPLYGLLFYAPITNQSDVYINGNSDDVFRGSLLFPGAPCYLNGTTSTFALQSQVICDTVFLGGTSGVTIDYGTFYYELVTPPALELTK